MRDDQARSDTARQIALAIRDEVLDLEAVGIGIIQIVPRAPFVSVTVVSSSWIC